MFLTVGIPFRNAEGTLADAIRAVFAQTCADWELLLVDDGSTDRSLEIARAVRDPRVRVIADGVNRGLAARLNQIVAEARCERVARMDADDLMSPRRFQRQLEVLVDDRVQIVTSAMAMLSTDLRPIGIRHGEPRIEARALLRGYGLAHAPLMARTEWFRCNQYDPTVLRGQDAELWCRAFYQGRLTTGDVLGIDEPLYFCREEAGISLAKVIGAHAGLRRLIREYGPVTLGEWGCRYELARSHLRSAALRALDSVGLMARVTSFARNRGRMTPAILQSVCGEIAEVRSTKVPGLD